MNLADHYETVFHTVTANSFPYPSHVKHFEIKMFTFVQNDVVFQDQVSLFLRDMICLFGLRHTASNSLPRCLYTVMLCFVTLRVMASARDNVHLPCL